MNRQQVSLCAKLMVQQPKRGIGLGLTKVGAIVDHGRLGEMQNAVVNVVRLAMSGFVARGPFGDYPLSSVRRPRSSCLRHLDVDGRREPEFC